jgi:hypothetical protein
MLKLKDKASVRRDLIRICKARKYSKKDMLAIIKEMMKDLCQN